MSTSNCRNRDEKEWQGRNMLLSCYDKVKNTERKFMITNKGDIWRLKKPVNIFESWNRREFL